ncbi:uncharacterized protein LOC131668572 [Phymastichus coffea]|uniref:uncharacterized protein LOC131668572 n=1 Tax=Phymastichus coffea TaxID=108790 RepID=UPI00273B1AA6|nr:uncharacterized protein LOC131668572 [Phymastichus coffea]
MEAVQYNMDNMNEYYRMDNTNEHNHMDNTNEHNRIDNTNEHYRIDNTNGYNGIDNMEAKIPSSFLDQQTFYGNPIKEEREPTNTPYITIYSIILFIWLYTIITVINYDTIPLEQLNLTREIDLLTIEQMHPRFTWKFPLCTIIGGLITVAYVYFLTQSIGRYIVYVGMLLICLTLLLLIGVFVFASLYLYAGVFGSILIIILFALLLLIIAYFIISFRCILNVGNESIFEIISDSCRALRYCPSITIFTCVMSVIIILILTFMVYITKIIIFSNCSDSIFRFYVIINLYCAVTLTNFFTNFTQIVIAGYVIDWVWLKDPTLNSLSIRHSFDRAFNFHMGTVAFFSIPLLPHIWSIYLVCKSHDSDSNAVKQYNFTTRFFSQLRVFMNVVDFGIIQTPIYGYECRTAIQAAHDLVSQNNHEINLAVLQISDMVIAFGSFLISLPFRIEHVNTSIYSLLIPFYIILATAVRTLLVNKMINNCTSEDLTIQYGNVPQHGSIMKE